MTTSRIVVGVDGSEAGLRALRWAIGEARRRGGSVRAITAYDWPGTEAAMLAGLGREGELKRAADILATAVEGVRREFPEVPIEAEALFGDPAHKLAEASRDADLLVVGSHGHGRLHTAVVGSVSEGCIRHAYCPVVVVPALCLEPLRMADAVKVRTQQSSWTIAGARAATAERRRAGHPSRPVGDPAGLGPRE